MTNTTMNKNELLDMFEEKFEIVAEQCAKANNVESVPWYEVFDSELMDEVEALISEELGYPATECEAYNEWYDEMAEDL